MVFSKLNDFMILSEASHHRQSLQGQSSCYDVGISFKSGGKTISSFFTDQFILKTEL